MTLKQLFSLGHEIAFLLVLSIAKPLKVALAATRTLTQVVHVGKTLEEEDEAGCCGL